MSFLRIELQVVTVAKIILLTGSLGVGKTTTLNHIAKHVHIDDIIVSDAARTNVDAQRTGATKSLQGCACCVALPELKKYLKDKEGTLLIEASGLSEADGISQAIAQHPTSWIHLVNAATYKGQSLSPTLKKFLDVADIILINKTDKSKDVKQLISIIRKYATGEVIPTEKGVFDTKKIVYSKHLAAKKKQRRHHQKAISIQLPGSIKTRTLQQLLEKYPRAKGWYTDKKKYSFDKTESFEKRPSSSKKNSISIIGVLETFDALHTALKLIGATDASLGQKTFSFLKQVPEIIWDMR